MMRYYMEEREIGVPGRVTLHIEPNPSRVAVEVFPLDRESYEAVLVTVDGVLYGDDAQPGGTAKAILAAIEIQQEQTDED